MKKLLLTLLAGLILTAPVLRAADAPKKPEPTIEQRVAGLEAYIAHGDPTAPLKVKVKDKSGKEVDQVPEGLTTVAASNSGPGHNGFQMICSALVLFMTLPGLFLFYGGLVRRKNVLSVVAQCFGIAGLVTILWYIYGYSFVFHSGGKFLGTLEWKFLNGVDSSPNTDYGAWVSHNVFSMYQLMFAIITPALIIGAIAERMKYSAILLFVTLW